MHVFGHILGQTDIGLCQSCFCLYTTRGEETLQNGSNDEAGRCTIVASLEPSTSCICP